MENYLPKDLCNIIQEYVRCEKYDRVIFEYCFVIRKVMINEYWSFSINNLIKYNYRTYLCFLRQVYIFIRSNSKYSSYKNMMNMNYSYFDQYILDPKIIAYESICLRQ